MHTWYVKEETKDGLLFEISNTVGDGDYWTSATLLIMSVLLCSSLQLMSHQRKWLWNENNFIENI